MKKIRLLVLAGWFVLSATRSGANAIVEDFSTNPLQNGWQIFGDTNLFCWNSTNQNLEVTWDSSKPNSYFYHPFGTILAKDDDFSLSFDLQINDIGPADSFEFSFQLALGFLNLNQATSPGFLRGTGFNATNLVEFAYFRDDPYGDPATVYPTFVDETGQFNYNQNQNESTNYVLTISNLFHVTMTYTASNQSLVTALTNLSSSDNIAITQRLGLTFSGEPFSDFRVDAISINSYSEAGQYPGYEGSVLAHGIVDNFSVTTPPPPIQNFTGAFTNNIWQAQFASRSNWLYTLESTVDLQSWTSVSSATSGNATDLFLQDTNPVASKAFYRVRAERP